MIGSVIRIILAVLLSVTALEATGGKTKHIILFIGDGTHLAHEIAASRYLTGRDDGLSFHSLPFRAFSSTWDVTTYNAFASVQIPPAPKYGPIIFNPRVGYNPLLGGSQPYPLERTVSATIMSNYFLTKINGSCPATDSASSATAVATGFKTDAANIAWAYGDPPDGALPSLAAMLRLRQGARIGIVSTVPFSHATPAAHVSHSMSRTTYHAMAQQITRKFKPDVVISGGQPSGTNYTFISKADYEWLRGAQNEWLFVERKTGRDGKMALDQAAQEALHARRKLFALFGGKDGNFDYNRPINQPGSPAVEPGSHENPLLKDCVRTALRVLSQGNKPLFALIEQGDIDWANHENNFRNMIASMWDLHEGVKAALDYVDRPGDDMDWDNTLLIVTADHANSYMRLPKPMGPGVLPEQVWVDKNKNSKIDSGEWTYPGEEVSYSTTGHTSELVTLYAKGAVSELFQQYAGGPLSWYPGTKIVDNTQVFRVMAEATGVLRTPRPR
jgi:alkaline phosphatase